MNTTPVLTEHARQRCAEMGISTKVAKRIVQYADVVRHSDVGSGQCSVAVSDRHPEYVVVFDAHEDPAVIVTVLYRDPNVTSRPAM